MSLNAPDTVRRWRMLPPNSRVLAAFSGGADSTVLLHFLCALRNDPAFSLTVYAVHVHHGLRGAEADQDEAFCREQCEKLGVELFVRRCDVRAEAARRKMTLEQAGREARYRCFAELSQKLDARVATAHTLNDSVETLLLNLARGSGLRGLCGIPPVRGNIVRPLIRDTRAAVEAYCAEHGLPYVTDRTNFSRAFARNRVRLDAMPALRSVNPAFPQTAGRLLDQLAADEALLEELAAQGLARAAAGNGLWQAAPLLGLPGPLRARALRQAARRAGCPELSAARVEELSGLLARKAGRLQLPGGRQAVLYRGTLSFGFGGRPPQTAARGKADGPARSVSTAAELSVRPLAPGRFGGRYPFRVRLCEGEPLRNYFKFVYKPVLNWAVDCAKIKGAVVLRGRRPGDRLRPAGRGVGKPVKKWLAELGVPADKRNAVPVAADGAGTLWVYGVGVDERCAAGPQTERAFLIEPERAPRPGRPEI